MILAAAAVSRSLRKKEEGHVLDDAKIQLGDERYCVFGGQFDFQQSEYIEAVSRQLMKKWQGYLSMDLSLDYIVDLFPLCLHSTGVVLAKIC